jgi:hypothetical protein
LPRPTQQHTATGTPANSPNESAEIIRRWLSASPPELSHPQGRDYYWSLLRKLGTWNADGVFAQGDDTQQENAT